MSAAQSMTNKFGIPTMLVVSGFMGSHNASGGNQSGMRVIDEVTGAVMWKLTTEPAGPLPFEQWQFQKLPESSIYQHFT